MLYLAGDLLLAHVALVVAYAVRFGTPLSQLELVSIVRAGTGATVLFICTNVLVLYIAETYEPGRDFRSPRQLLRIWGGVSIAVLLQMALFYTLPNWGLGRGVFVLANGSLLVMLTGWRYAMSLVRPRLEARMRTVILGADETGHVIANAISQDSEHRDRYELIGFVDDPEELVHPVEEPSKLLVVSNRSSLRDWVKEENVDCIIVAIRSGMTSELTRQLLDCKKAGVRIEDMRAVYKRMSGKVPVRYVSDTSIIFGPEFAGARGMGAMLQRAADMAIAAVGLLFSAPIIAVAGLAVIWETRGPMFYTQVRVGQDEKPFHIVKLRTMGVDAEAKSGAVWSQGSADPRVTRVGRFLRRTRIDELPQFWNVLTGDMSMVGPRPERPHFVEQLKEQIPYYAMRSAVKPGVTGWAQVMYRYGASVDDSREKLCYDLYAIQEMTPALYFVILVKTVQTVLLKPGS